jgi:DNA repair protein RecO (recombination protein O)
LSTIVTEAIVLRQVATGEADRVVTLYTRARGKVTAMAHAAAKSRRRFGGALSLYVLGEAALVETPRRELLTLERFDARRDFAGRLADPVRMGHAAYATELVRELSPPYQVDAALLELLLELYEVAAAREPRADTLRAFELRLLDGLGLRPALDRCVACGSADEARLEGEGVRLDPARGGLMCAACAGPGGGTDDTLPATLRRRLLALQDLELARAAVLPPAPSDVTAGCRELLHATLRTHLTAPLKSLEFLHKLR